MPCVVDIRFMPASVYFYPYINIWSYQDGFAKVMKIAAKPFIVTPNVADALLYIEDMSSLTFSS